MNLKGIKLRLRNKQPLAINKFPKVWESVLRTHSAFQGQLHSLTNRLATARLQQLHQAQEKQKWLTSVLLPCWDQNTFLSCKKGSGPATEGTTLHLNPCLNSIASPLHPTDPTSNTPFLSFFNHICISFKERIMTLFRLPHLPPPSYPHFPKKYKHHHQLSPKKSIHWVTENQTLCINIFLEFGQE